MISINIINLEYFYQLSQVSSVKRKRKNLGGKKKLRIKIKFAHFEQYFSLTKERTLRLKLEYDSKL